MSVSFFFEEYSKSVVDIFLKNDKLNVRGQIYHPSPFRLRSDEFDMLGSKSMKFSELFSKTQRDISKDEVSVNAQYLIKGGFISKQMAGVYTFLPLGLRVLRNIEKIIRKEINAIGGQEVLMPTLTQAENYKLTGRDKIDVLLRTKLHTGSEIILNQSHEEVVTPLVKQFVNSYKDLPKYVYQIQTKFRNEPRAKSGILRGREFIMKDLYSFHADEKDLEKYYDLVTKAYLKIFKQFGLDAILTYASGGTFSKYSHEFQVVTDAGEDEIYLCPKCNVAINKEIIDEQKVCPKCGNHKLEIKKSIEVGNIFKLKDKFTKAFDFNFINSDGKTNPVIMGCYGLGLTRVMGAVVEVNHDEKGIIWPITIAPYKIHLISLGQDKEAEKIYNDLIKNGYEVLFDDRIDATAGQKFSDADLIGLPIRIVVSKKTLEKDSVEIKLRNQDKVELINIKKILDKINKRLG